MPRTKVRGWRVLLLPLPAVHRPKPVGGLTRPGIYLYNANIIAERQHLMNQLDFTNRIQQLVHQLVRNYELCDRMCLARHEVTASQAYTLLAFPRDSDVSMNELSEAMGLANSTMTRMIDHLVRKGLADRRHDDEDRRVVRVTLTPKGQKMRRTFEKERQEIYREVLADIQESDHPAIIGSLERVTKAIAAAMKKCCA